VLVARARVSGVKRQAVEEDFLVLAGKAGILKEGHGSTVHVWRFTV